MLKMKINPNKLRKHVLDMVYEKQSGHIGGSFSMAEITAYLYNNYGPLFTSLSHFLGTSKIKKTMPNKRKNMLNSPPPSCGPPPKAASSQPA